MFYKHSVPEKLSLKHSVPETFCPCRDGDFDLLKEISTTLRDRLPLTEHMKQSSLIGVTRHKMRFSLHRVPLLVLLVLVALTSVLRAQSTDASLTGRITDPNKAVIVGANVSAISAGTDVRYKLRPTTQGPTTWPVFRPASIASRSKRPASRS